MNISIRHSSYPKALQSLNPRLFNFMQITQDVLDAAILTTFYRRYRRRTSRLLLSLLWMQSTPKTAIVSGRPFERLNGKSECSTPSLVSASSMNKKVSWRGQFWALTIEPNTRRDRLNPGCDCWTQCYSKTRHHCLVYFC